MKGDNLPTDDHIVRYVKPSMIEEDGTANGAEFRLRPHRPDETGVSVNWLEAFPEGKDHQLSEVRRLYRLSVKAKGRFAEINIGTMLKHVAEELNTLQVIHDPLEANEKYDVDPSHAEITGLPAGDSDQALLVGDLIAECVINLHPAIKETT